MLEVDADTALPNGLIVAVPFNVVPTPVSLGAGKPREPLMTLCAETRTDRSSTARIVFMDWMISVVDCSTVEDAKFCRGSSERYGPYGDSCACPCRRKVRAFKGRHAADYSLAGATYGIVNVGEGKRPSYRLIARGVQRSRSRAAYNPTNLPLYAATGSSVDPAARFIVISEGGSRHARPKAE